MELRPSFAPMRHHRPQGESGVVVTSSELTGPAKDFAIENGVQFIERVNFITGISWRR
jgi:HJR/Mrr/RecB family endonuclease